MRKSPIFLFIVVVLLLDLIFFQKIVVAGLRPDATVIVLVYLALRFGSVLGMIFGFLIGLASLVIMTTALASMPLATTVVGYVVGKFGKKVAYESPLVQLAILFLSVLLLDAINFLWLDPEHLVFNLARYSMGSAFYTGLVGVGLAQLVLRLTHSRRIV